MPHDHRQSSLHKRVRSHGIPTLREKLFDALHKLADQDTVQTGYDELEAILMELPHDQSIPEALSLICEHRCKQGVFTRKEIAKVLGLACYCLRGALTSYAPKLIKELIRRLKDSNHHVRAAAAESFGQLARWVPLPHNATKTPLSDIFRALFAALHEPSRETQHAAGTALGSVVRHAPDLVSAPVELERLVPKLSKEVVQQTCQACTPVLEAIEALFRLLPTVSVSPHRTALAHAAMHCLDSLEWQARAAAASALLALGVRHRAGVSEMAGAVLEALERCRYDSSRPVRENVLEAIQVFSQCKAPSKRILEETIELCTSTSTRGPLEHRDGPPTKSASSLDWDPPYTIGGLPYPHGASHSPNNPAVPGSTLAPPGATVHRNTRTSATSRAPVSSRRDPEPLQAPPQAHKAPPSSQPAHSSHPRTKRSVFSCPNQQFFCAGSSLHLQQPVEVRAHIASPSSVTPPRAATSPRGSAHTPTSDSPGPLDPASSRTEREHDYEHTAPAVEHPSSAPLQKSPPSSPELSILNLKQMVQQRDSEIELLRAQIQAQHLQVPHPLDAEVSTRVFDQALSKNPQEACSQLLLNGDDLQLMRLLRRLPVHASVDSFGGSTASELASKLASLVGKSLFVEDALPWLDALVCSDKLSKQSSTTLEATIFEADIPSQFSLERTRLCEAIRQRRDEFAVS